MKLIDKIAQLDKEVYKKSRVDEMRRIAFHSRGFWIKTKNKEDVFKFILEKMIGIPLKEAVAFLEYKVKDNNRTFLLEEYEKNKIVIVTYVVKDSIYRITYKMTTFSNRTRVKYVSLMKRQERIFGTKNLIAKYFWKREARGKSKRFKIEVRSFIRKKNKNKQS